MQRYGQQEVKCEHCEGAGKMLVEWEEYVFLHLPDRMREGLDALNKKIPTIKLDWADIAHRANMPPAIVDGIMTGRHTCKLAELYKLADALEVRLTDLLPIGS